MADDGVDKLMANVGLAYRRRKSRRRQRHGRLPWWLISLVVHGIALILLGMAPYAFVVEEPERPPLAINLIPATQEPPEPEPEPDPPEPDESDPEEPPPDDTGPAVPRPGERPSPGDDSASDNTTPRPATATPSSAARTPTLAVEVRERGYDTAIFARRSADGRSRAVGRRGGTTVHAERAVDIGLMWLARVQERDGHWDCKAWGGRDAYDVGTTGLALLALLGAGHTHQKGRFQANVHRGLEWLKSRQAPDGKLAWKTFYEQGIAATAACEAFGLTRDLRLMPLAQGAIQHICAIQPEHGGFRYEGPVRQAEGDLSVTGWQILALRSALCAGLDVPDEALERSRTFLANSVRDDGGSAYLVSDTRSSAAMTAMGMLARQFVGGEGYDQQVRAAAEWLINHERRVRGPGKGKDRLVGDLYYTYYSTLAMYQFGGDAWQVWNRLFRDGLLAAQVRDARDTEGRWIRGSWDPGKHHWGSAGGRIYATAMAVMSLEVYYRYLPVYRR